MPALAPATPPVRRILIAHDRRAQRGGIDNAVDDEATLLQRRGHDLRLVVREPRAGGSNPRTTIEVDTLLDEFRPDLVHVHDSDTGVAPSICAAAARRGIAVVQTLHDFALLCPQRELRAGASLCEACVGRLPWRAVTRGCFAARADAAAAATRLTLQRLAGSARRHVGRWIVDDEYGRQRFVAGGLPADRIRVHASGVDLPPLEEMPRHGFLYVGRLAAEKGPALLAEACAFEFPTSPVRLAGSGPLAKELEGNARLQLLGPVTSAAVYEEMRRALALVVPSLAPARCPRVVVEAFALGLPVIASRAGALAELVEEGRTGLFFAPGSGIDLAAKLHWAENHPDRMYAMGLAARLRYQRDYSHDAAYRRLAAIYAEAADRR